MNVTTQPDWTAFLAFTSSDEWWTQVASMKGVPPKRMVIPVNPSMLGAVEGAKCQSLQAEISPTQPLRVQNTWLHSKI
jgi:hypothetical protein